MDEIIAIKLESFQVRAIIDYGYPYSELKKELEKHSSASTAVIKASFGDWEQAVGNLSISVNHNGRKGFPKLGGSTIELLDEVASMIERKIGI